MNVNKVEIQKKGFLEIDIDKSLNLVSEIKKMKEEKNAVILAHYYQIPEIQDIADFVGDSLALSQKAAETYADIIVFAGVHFMAETAKSLSPEKMVLIPDSKAGCSLADSCPPKEFKEFKEKFPEYKVVSYVNTTSEIKALTDVVCTSTNAKLIIDSFPLDEKIIFAPDRNLGNYLNSITGRNMKLWDGACHVHEEFSLEKILDIKQEYPNAKIIAHPECQKQILIVADYIGSTSGLLKFIENDDCDTFIVVTESGILHQMQKSRPNKNFIPAPPNDSTCACNDCKYMRLHTIEKLYTCLKYEIPEVTLDEELRKKAVRPIIKMLEISKKQNKI
ncbi:MAG: quinolinate synthase NadA [Bacteroidetes bacterium]|jgi:quinolinate synthase|nr:quinolinate synthase NadA [Bacteroidota bacterium]MBT6687486.1 quinolinate synthase NadA [Bacteroidota bacterium]MBT7142672.1 quinolinate synthase NadA [Bacteroidota bacterium]MBT7491077.1 quinolinate synthase NadA [Bacteroidota bacterium]